MDTSKMRVCILLVIAASIPMWSAVPDLRQITSALQRAREAGQLRIFYSGSSITCGTGVSSDATAFPALVAVELERLLSIAVQTLNVCYGGATSMAQLGSLKQEGLPLNPDLLILEVGILDKLSPMASAAAMESICRVAVSNRMPSLVVYPFTHRSLATDHCLEERSRSLSSSMNSLMSLKSR